MKKLDLMLIRSIKLNKAQLIAASLVIFAGLSIFLAANISYKNFVSSMDLYSKQYKFLDYYADVDSISREEMEDLKKVDGVKEVMGRVSMDVGADTQSGIRVTVRIISLPDNSRPQINDLYIMSGSYLNNSKPNYCLLSKTFANYNKLSIGSTLSIIVNSSKYNLTVKGTVTNPEYLFAVKSSDSFTSSEKDFGIVYVNESTLWYLFGMQDTYNQVHFLFDEKANTDVTIRNIENILKKYGFKSGTRRKDQISYSYFHENISQISSFAYLFSNMFLAIAAIIIFISQRRIISNERVLIGVMKALGHSNSRILFHYVKYSIAIFLLGSIPGIIAGYFLAFGMTYLFQQMFFIPVLELKVYWDVMLLGIGLSLFFCLFAGLIASKSVLKIHPAEAMRAEVPKMSKGIPLEKITFLWKRLPFRWKMSTRNVFRSPQRTWMTCIGIISSIVVIIVAFYFYDVTYYIMDKHFNNFQQYDYKIAFTKPMPAGVMNDLKDVLGNSSVVPIIEMPVELKNGWKKEGSMIVGLNNQKDSLRFIGMDRKPIDLPEKGLLISHKLAQKLNLKPGDTVTIKTYLGKPKDIKLLVAGLTKKYMEYNCYINMEELVKSFGEGEFYTGALVKSKGGLEKKYETELYKMPCVLSFEGSKAVLSTESFTQFLQMNDMFSSFMILFGAIMGFAIIYNTTSINVSERKRELASMRVMGYSLGYIKSSMIRENLMLCAISILPGCLLGKILANYLGQMYSGKMNTFENVIYFRVYIISAVCVIFFTFLAQWANNRKISTLDMIEVLKNREG